MSIRWEASTAIARPATWDPVVRAISTNASPTLVREMARQTVYSLKTITDVTAFQDGLENDVASELISARLRHA